MCTNTKVQIDLTTLNITLKLVRRQESRNQVVIQKVDAFISIRISFIVSTNCHSHFLYQQKQNSTKSLVELPFCAKEKVKKLSRRSTHLAVSTNFLFPQKTPRIVDNSFCENGLFIFVWKKRFHRRMFQKLHDYFYYVLLLAYIHVVIIFYLVKSKAFLKFQFKWYSIFRDNSNQKYFSR